MVMLFRAAYSGYFPAMDGNPESAVDLRRFPAKNIPNWLVFLSIYKAQKD